MYVSASMVQRGEDAAKGEKASWWAGRDPEMETLEMVCPVVGAEDVWGEVFANLGGCCCVQKGGKLWFPFKGIQSELHIDKHGFSLKYIYIKANSQNSLIISLSRSRSLLSVAALSECPVALTKELQDIKKTFQSSPKQILFSFQLPGTAWNGYLNNFRHGTTTGMSTTSPLTAAHPQASSAPHSEPWVLCLTCVEGCPLSWGVCGEGAIPRSCRATVGYEPLGMCSTTKDQQFHFLVTWWLQVSWAVGEILSKRARQE